VRTAKFYTPTVTAFDPSGALDAAANQAVWDHVIAGGVDGIVLMGSTGEFFAMTTPQKHELIDLAVAHIAGRAELIVGTACMRVDETIALANYALDAAADAVMVVGPYYFALDDAATFAYFDAVATSVRGDLYLYNFPDRTGYDLSPEVTLRLARKHANVVGYKDTLFSSDHTRRLLTTVLPERPDFRVLAGFDEFLHRTVTSGGTGAIGGLSNLYPELCARYAAAVRDGDFERITASQRVIDKAMELYSIGTPFVPILKKAMVLRGLPMDEHCLAPVQPATDEQTAQLRALMDAVESLARQTETV
jgi:4-hydroxy-tetrahydrodipicolinate synthase